VGWDFDLGEVRCSLRSGVPDYAYAKCKRFELDGQLLTRDGTTNSYHTFVETFQKIEYLPASRTWQVINPNGTIFRYGLGSDAQVRSGPDIARWLLSEIEDPFGNKIFFSYDDTIDAGTRYPRRITYGPDSTRAFGVRSVEFSFEEDRPDPLHDFTGGIERELTKRLTSIQVSSYGALVRRYAFGYELTGTEYTTGRSRLSWVQVFGNDCTGDIGQCAGLPRQEFEYTDPNDDDTTQQPYSKFMQDQDYVVPFAGNWWVGAPPVRIADVDGDGLPDLVKGGIYFGDPRNLNDTHVELNTGSGFVEDAAWTAALRNLEVERPRAEFSQIEPDLSSGGGHEVLHWGAGTAGIFEAHYSTVKRAVSDTPPAATARPEARSSGGAIANVAPGVSLPGWIEGLGRLFFTDVDADGLADIIVSVRLSGVDKVLDPQGIPILPSLVEREPGRVVRMVYRNTGDPALGWIEDARLAAGLPPFGVVQFESGYGAESKIPFGFANGFDVIMSQIRTDPCSVRGLNGWYDYAPPDFLVGNIPDVCINLVNLDPRFQDLNGDGYLDLMVLELDDREALYQGMMNFYNRGTDAPPLPNNHARSRAWIQVPDADVDEDRWVRAAEYDLPNVPFQVPGTGGFWPIATAFPFAHSQPNLASGSEPPPNCPGPGGIVPNWESCAPLSYNVNLSVELVDLNRDGLSDVIWSRYHAGTNVGLYPEFPLIAQGVFLNTGTGWCSSIPELAVYVESECAHARIYYPPANSYPTIPAEPSGFAISNSIYTGSSTGHLADLNADGWLDYIQAHTSQNYPGYKAWLFDPAGASQSTPTMWIRDTRYDLGIEYGLIFAAYADALGFSVLDINGDGAADVVGDDLRDQYDVEHPQAFISRSRHSDLLRLVRNGTGGQMAISYESAIVQRDLSIAGLETQAADHATATGEALGNFGATSGDVMRWTSAPVVSEVRIAGPNRKPDSEIPGSAFGPPEKYRYAHPRFCVKSRSNLGYRLVARTRPGGEVVTSRFYQFHGRAGKTSSVVVSEGGLALHSYEEDWEIQPQVPEWVPGSIDHADVHVGRLSETRSMNLYENGMTGSQRTRTLYYDDLYGYNFVARAIEIRPTGTLVSLRVPDSDVSKSIFGLLAEEKIFDHEAADLSDMDFQKHTLIDYQFGRPSNLVEMLKSREDGGPGTAESHTMRYDAYGNPTRQVIHASSGDQIADFCYDGDHAGGEDANWCPDLGQNSHSVRIGRLDTAGGISTFTPDFRTGAIIEFSSTYTDEPSSRTTLDGLGRPVESFVESDGDWLRTTRTEYDDLSSPPIVARYDYPEAGAGDSDAVWSSTVFDGFGRVWKEIAETPSGFVATLVYHDPFARTTRKSLPIECAEASCSGLIGDTQPFASLMQRDGIGRPVRRDDPHGTSIFDYFSLTKTSGPGATAIQFDGILEKNGKGDLSRRAIDGDRFGWIEACGNSVAATTSDISSIPCAGPEHTQTDYAYEATGEISKIYDTKAVSPFDDPEHFLQFRYDTLGRVLQIDDPALSGSGNTRTRYDTYGNVQQTLNARLQLRTYTYDDLNRLTGITTPDGETNYALAYRENEKSPSGDSSDDYQRTINYDGLGRIQREQMAIRNASGSLQSFYTDYAYDLLGRVTEILHPAKHYDSGSWKNTTIRYEYDRGYLTQVCDLGDAAHCDSAKAKIVSAVGVDSLGRRESITFPGGVRSLAYTPDTHRLARDDFSSPTYRYTRHYESYDGVGNILSVSGSESGPGALDMNESYVYDQQDRIQQWIKQGTSYDYAYDDLGNLTLHAGETQIFDDDARPHAIQRRDLISPIEYSYDDDGNVKSILEAGVGRYFDFDSANQIVCLGENTSTCDTRVAYDINGKRVAEYPAGGRAFNAYIGDAFLYEHRQVVAHASVEIMLDGERIALKRFNPQLRGSNASLFTFQIQPPWVIGGLACGGLLFILSGTRNDAFALVWEIRPLRVASALTAASSLLIPSIANASIPRTALAPSYFWEISDPLGTGILLVDKNGIRIRHQVFTPFGRVHEEIGGDFRTFYAGHRRNEDTDLFYMQARWYDPGAGRFLSVDPLLGPGSPESHNPYSYADNNPIARFDPTGRFGEQEAAIETKFINAGEFGPGNPSGGSHPVTPIGGVPPSVQGVSFPGFDGSHGLSGSRGAAQLSRLDSGIVNSLGALAAAQPDHGEYSLPFTHLSFGAAGGSGLVGGFNAIVDISQLGNPELAELFFFGGLGVGAQGHLGAQAVMGGTIGRGRPAAIGFGSMLSGGLFGVGLNFDARLGLSSRSLELTPSGGIVFGGFACFCASLKVGRGPLLQAVRSFQRGAAKAIETGASPFFAQAP
jgi:RHS repeat-associated protein